MRNQPGTDDRPGEDEHLVAGETSAKATSSSMGHGP
jgi:hypothetical protein